MRAQSKVVLLVGLILVLVLGAVVWKTQDVVQRYSSTYLADSAMKQIAPLKRLVSERMETEKNNLVRFATSREAQGPGHATGFGTFDAVALVEPSQNQWAPTWIEKGSGLRGEKWPQGYELTLLRSLPYAKVKDGSSLWVRLSDSQGAPLYAILNSVEIQTPVAASAALQVIGNSLPEAAVPKEVAPPGRLRSAVIVGFTSENPLSTLTEDFIGSTNNVYIVDDRGYVASHVKRDLLGTSFSADPITKETTRTRNLSGTKQVRDMDGEIVTAHFEKIDRTNLTAVIATPIAVTSGLANSVMSSALTVGAAALILSLLLAWFIAGRILSASEGLAAPALRKNRFSNIDFESEEDASPESTQARAVPVVLSAAELAKAEGAKNYSPELNRERLLSERKNAFEAFNAGLASRLREPLLAILGHAQLAKAKAKSMDPDVAAHFDSIDREARLAKDAIERFQVIEETPSLGRVEETADLEKSVLAALAEKAIEIEGSGIRLEQHLTHVPRVRGRSADIESSVVHILENAIEALRDRPTKQISIRLSWLSERIRLVISDSGAGMTRDVQERAFEPFYKSFEAPRHMGLGLAFVQTTLNRIGASADIQTSPGEGTVFTIEFPVEAAARADFEAATAAPDIQKINESIDSFTLGGLKPYTVGANRTDAFPDAPIIGSQSLQRAQSLQSSQFEPLSSEPIDFKVQIRAPRSRR